MKKTKIFFDMDDTIVDFTNGFKRVSGMSPDDYEKKHGDNSIFRDIISPMGANYWKNLLWLKEGEKVFNYALKNPNLDIYILSAPSRDNSSKIGKMEWLSKNTSIPKSKIILDRNKGQYVTDPSDILIDDRDKYLKTWKGVRIKFVNDAKKAIAEIEKNTLQENYRTFAEYLFF